MDEINALRKKLDEMEGAQSALIISVAALLEESKDNAGLREKLSMLNAGIQVSFLPAKMSENFLTGFRRCAEVLQKMLP